MDLSVTVQIKPSFTSFAPAKDGQDGGLLRHSSYRLCGHSRLSSQLIDSIRHVEIAVVRPLTEVSWLNSGLKRPVLAGIGLCVQFNARAPSLTFTIKTRETNEAEG
jgi:hypothetical protein